VPDDRIWTSKEAAPVRVGDLMRVEWALSDLAEVREHLSGLKRPVPRRIYELSGALCRALLQLETEQEEEADE
jgi:hypothetical protein